MRQHAGVSSGKQVRDIAIRMFLNKVGVVPDEEELARAATQNQHLANCVEDNLATLVLRTRAYKIL